MKVKTGSPEERTIHIPPAPIHTAERDKKDLERFRAAMEKLTPKQQEKVISRIARPDIP